MNTPVSEQLIARLRGVLDDVADPRGGGNTQFELSDIAMGAFSAS